MNKIKANSSNLESFWYNKDKKRLTIEFWSGSIYEYADVPEQLFNELRLAESQGSYFYKNIRSNFIYKKLKKEGN